MVPGTESETRPMTAPERAPLGAALALLMALVALTGAHSPALVAVAVAVIGVAVGIAWPSLLELPSAPGTRLVVGGTGVLGAVGALLIAGRDGAVSAVIMVCAIGVFASFVHQMVRRERTRLTDSLTGTVAGVMLTGLGSCWVLAQVGAVDGGTTGLVAAIALGLAVTLLVDATALPTALRIVLATVLGTALTVYLAGVLAGVDPLPAAAVGLVTSVGACGAHLLLGSALMAKEPAASLAVAGAPVATVGVVTLMAVNLLA